MPDEAEHKNQTGAARPCTADAPLQCGQHLEGDQTGQDTAPRTVTMCSLKVGEVQPFELAAGQYPDPAHRADNRLIPLAQACRDTLRRRPTHPVLTHDRGLRLRSYSGGTAGQRTGCDQARRGGALDATGAATGCASGRSW